MSPAPAVLVMVRVPQPDDRPPLADRLGWERWAALQRVMIRRCVTWAEQVAREPVCVAAEPAFALGDLRSLVGGRVDIFAQEGAEVPDRLAGAAARARAPVGSGAPLLIAWPELPHWRPEHAEAALGDLAAGCDLALGPVFDGGFYVIAMRRPLPDLLALPACAWQGPDAIGMALAVAGQGGAEVGLLRAERGLRSPADVQAALADPLLDAELRELLEPPP